MLKMGIEREQPPLEELSLEVLTVMDELLNLEESKGKNVTVAREKVWELINEKLNDRKT